MNGSNGPLLHNESSLPSTSKLSSIAHDAIGPDDVIEYVIEDEIPFDGRHLNRVHEELEKLNIATDVINKLESQLDEARATFRRIQSTWSQKLNELSRKYGSAITKGRPYYEAKLTERQLREEAQNAAICFERANSMHAVAKQQVSLTQDSLNRQRTIESECLEVLNHHINRVNEAERERLEAEETHRSISTRMAELTRQIVLLEKSNARAIRKSRHYFEQRVEFARILEQQKSLIVKLEAEVRQKKLDYTSSLRNLEQISDAIHEERSLSSLKREQGVTHGSSEFYSHESLKSLNSVSALDVVSTEQRAVDDGSRARRFSFDEISLECDKTIDPSLYDEALTDEANSVSSKSNSLGSGVILLAQQLMRNQEKPRNSDQNVFRLSAEITDFRYRTELPEGVETSRNSTFSFSVDGSDSESSLGSIRTRLTGNTDDELTGMFSNHSQISEKLDDSSGIADGKANTVLIKQHANASSDNERDSGHSSCDY